MAWLMQLMRMAEGAPLGARPLWERGDLSREGLLLEYLRECRVVRKGLDGNLRKARARRRPAPPCFLLPPECSTGGVFGGGKAYLGRSAAACVLARRAAACSLLRCCAHLRQASGPTHWGLLKCNQSFRLRCHQTLCSGLIDATLVV